jgi:hypothetical protein
MQNGSLIEAFFCAMLLRDTRSFLMKGKRMLRVKIMVLYSCYN